MELMIDFETLGTDEDAVVISLGACFFDIENGTLGSTFYMAFEIEDQIKKGRVISPSTLKWWMGQSNAAKKVFHEQAKPTQQVLQTFATWVGSVASVSKVKPWGNGSTFDISIIEHMFRQFQVKAPWLYYNVMDLRTFKRFVANNVKVEKLGTNHNAVDDAISQAKFVLAHIRKGPTNVSGQETPAV